MCIHINKYITEKKVKTAVEISPTILVYRAINYDILCIYGI